MMETAEILITVSSIVPSTSKLIAAAEISELSLCCCCCNHQSIPSTQFAALLCSYASLTAYLTAYRLDAGITALHAACWSGEAHSSSSTTGTVDLMPPQLAGGVCSR
jgi:hypothetical protein